jgi:hypothetical protein
MDDRSARRHALSEWFMEFSVLWAVFPLLDQLLESRRLDVTLTTLCLAVSWISDLGGIILRKGEPE